jgi:Ca2+/H+ antiporter
VLLAARGELRLAAEIELASAAQVAGFLIPAEAILSWATDPLALSLRLIELASIGGAAFLAAIALSPARTSRPLGTLLIGAYGAFVVAFYFAGSR